MNLFDPLRETTPTGRPLYYWHGSAVAAIPTPDVASLRDDVTGGVKFCVSVMLKTGDNRFEWHSCECTDLNSCFADWIADPEDFMLRWLAYAGPHSATAGAGATVEDTPSAKQRAQAMRSARARTPTTTDATLEDLL